MATVALNAGTLNPSFPAALGEDLMAALAVP
jgi:hypothetical protein